ncbi:aminoglycoside phosphotransferase family protein [Streptomyces hainanensis]|uniref:Kinase n=1 Tax=Streptomyces hainanensis TaxID=402648 RepID=A0A4R4TGB5_9ACTN|nr:aminoglycoside phosphotransferase family protein [Streptomyces hainanensis]TDC76768.1 kinase [Streptomyces hainanensis]
MIAIPGEFARATVAREGERGAAWLGELPAIVGELVERWGCVPDGEVMHGGVAVVVPVRRAAEGAAVVKVSFPHPGNVHEPDAFAAWAGRGAVRLHERDDDRFAMLLERAGTSTLAQVADGDEVLRVAGRLSRRLAVPAPPGLPALQERADAWEEELRRDAEELSHPLAPGVLAAATATVRELGRDQPDTVIHGDLHPRNILRAEREPWLAVDPKGLAGDPAHDGGTLLKSFSLRLIDSDDLPGAVHHALDVYSEAAGLDRERVRRWAQLHAVQAAFWARRHGFRIARGGPELERITAFVDAVATLLTAPGPEHPTR